MKKKIKYTDEPIKLGRRAKDILPKLDKIPDPNKMKRIKGPELRTKPNLK